MKSIAGVLCALLFTGCFMGCGATGGHTNHDLGITDTVNVPHDAGQTLLYGTHLNIWHPPGFNFIPSTDRLEKGKSTLKAVETMSVPYEAKHEQFMELTARMKSAGFKNYYVKDFVLNGEPATIVYGANAENHDKEEITFLTGDEHRSFVLFGTCFRASLEDRAAIVKAMLSAYFADSGSVDISGIQGFTVDMQGSPFRYNSTAAQIFFYTVDGKGDPLGNSPIDGIDIGQMAPLPDSDVVHEKLTATIDNFIKNGFHVDTRADRAVSIHGMNGYEVILRGGIQGKAAVVYCVIVQNDKIAVSFASSAFDHHEEYLALFEKIARTLRPKL